MTKQTIHTMKTNSLIRAFAYLLVQFYSLWGFSQPNISQVSAPTSSGLYEKYEVSFDLNSYSNPYDPEIINVYAEFWSPSGEYFRQNAFYYEGRTKTDPGIKGEYVETLIPNQDNGWKIRFSPTEIGQWRFRIIAIDANQSSVYPSNGFVYFNCTSSSKHGFIETANNRYLQFSDGTPYYPVGNSLPWFHRPIWRGTQEYGTNQIKGLFDDMASNGIDFVRFEVNFIEGLNLIGWDFVDQTNYCKFYNQRDAWQLDEILEYAEGLDINILFAVFAHSAIGDDGFFQYQGPNDTSPNQYNDINSNGDTLGGYCHGAWSRYHPYNGRIHQGHEPQSPDAGLNLQSPYEWYTDSSAKSEQKKLIRYILARWGYSPNLFGLELMDEADQLAEKNRVDTNPFWIDKPSTFSQDLEDWHFEMKSYIDGINTFDHLVTTAYASMSHPSVTEVYTHMDFNQVHHYTDYLVGNQNGVLDNYYSHTQNYHNQFDKPHAMGEFFYIDYGSISTLDPHLYNVKDALWATFFNGSFGPAWLWTQYEVDENNASNIYNGISNFVKQLPPLSKEHRPYYHIGTEFRMFYLKDLNADEYYGWIQDINFTYRNLLDNHLNYLQSLSFNDRPNLSSSNYSTNLSVSRIGNYRVKWYNTESGNLHSTQNIFTNNGTLTITMPSALRNGKHADAAFIVEFVCNSQWNTSVLNAGDPANVRTNSPTVTSDNGQVTYIGNDNRIHQMYWNGFYWQHAVLNANAPQNVRSDSDLAIDGNGNVFFVATDNRVHIMYWTGSYWQEATLNSAAPQNVRPRSSLVTDQAGNVYFVGTDARVHQYYYNSTYWQEATLNVSAPQNVAFESDLACDHLGKIYFTGTDWRIHQYYYSGGQWNEATLNSSAPQNVRRRLSLLGGWVFIWAANSPLTCDPSGAVYFAASDNRVHNYYWNGSFWQEATLNVNAPQNLDVKTDLLSDDNGKIHFIANDHRVHQYYWAGSQWNEAVNNINDPVNVRSGLSTDGENIFYAGTNYQVWSSYWGCNDLFKSNNPPAEFIGKKDDLQLKVYPNPSNGLYTVLLTDNSNSKLDLFVYDVLGNLLRKSEAIESSELKLDIQDLPKGIYLLKIKKGEQVYSERIIKN